jgi:hypothetical protein
VAVAVAAAATISMRAKMRGTQLGLIFAALSCAEPTSVSLAPPAPPAIEGQRQTNSYTINDASHTVYVRLVQIRGEGDEPVYAFVRRMFASADSADAERLVIDLRSISGSDARLAVPLVKGVLTRDRFAKGGGLYVVVGADSFASAQTAATLLQRYANPILVHELP